FGLGGVATELLGDVTFRLASLTDEDARRMVRSIRGHALLAGFRGAPAADEAALADVILRVARLAREVPDVREIDLNPVRAFAKGRGACAIDARIRGSGGLPHRSRNRSRRPRRAPPSNRSSSGRTPAKRLARSLRRDGVAR